jgi:GrpB-like predicted nucleotidyltransferase (UPF0157 family)
LDEIELSSPDVDWPRRFEEEAARLQGILPDDLLIGLEHIGSTAVPDLPAKPIIDIMGLVTDLSAARERLVEPLKSAGYAFWADNPANDRLFFVKGLPPSAPRRTHHLHLMERGPAEHRHLAFRDYLRAHPDEARRYAALKAELAERFRTDREAYTEAKAAYIESLVAKTVS